MKPVYEDGKPKKSASLNETRAANAQVPQWVSCCDNGLGKWAGYVAYPTWYVYDVDVSFHAPCIPSSWTTNFTDSSHWSGVAGLDSWIFQSGTESDTDWLGRPVYYAFVENTNPNGNGPGTGENYTFSIHCGDNMYSFNEIDQSGGYTPYMYIEDVTSGNYSAHEYGQGNTQDTFECISEKSNDRNGLADFNYVAFIGCEAADRSSNWSYLTGNFKVEEFVPHDSAGNQLMSVSGLGGGTDFDTYWDRST